MRHQFTARLLSQNVQYNYYPILHQKKVGEFGFTANGMQKKMQNTHNVSATNPNFPPIEVLHWHPQKKKLPGSFSTKETGSDWKISNPSIQSFINICWTALNLLQHVTLLGASVNISSVNSRWMVWSSFSKPKMVILFWDDITTKTSPKKKH